MDIYTHDGNDICYETTSYPMCGPETELENANERIERLEQEISDLTEQMEE